MVTQHAGSKGFGNRLAQERRLKSVRDQVDIQKQDVAKAARVDNATYGRWERGTVPGDDAMIRLADYFGVTPAKAALADYIVAGLGWDDLSTPPCFKHAKFDVWRYKAKKK